MEKFYDTLAQYVIKNTEYEKSDYISLKYGFQVGIEMLICILVSMLISFGLDMCIENILLVCVFISLRTYGGGIHLNGFISCLICSNCILTGILLICKYYVFPILIILIIEAVCSIYLYIAEPVGTKNRIMDEEEKCYFGKKLKNRVIEINVLNVILILLGCYKYAMIIVLTLFVVCVSMFGVLSLK
ncbi:MAG: accessory gene regulator B family protein [Lachnospiraceae bacterium]